MELERILIAVGAGDRQAFDTLYRQLRRPMLAHALAVLAGDLAAAEDAVDEAFCAIWKNAAGYSGTGSAAGWVRRIVRNKAIDSLRKGVGREEAWDETRAVTIVDDAPDPEASALAQDGRSTLFHAMDTLSADQREAIMLCYFEEMSVSEISSVTACPEGTVKTRLYYAREKLRGWLDTNTGQSVSTAAKIAA